MAASDHLSPQQFLYHVSSGLNRESIQNRGLLKQHGQGRVYVGNEETTATRDGPGYDTWKVDVSGIPLREDKLDPPGSYYAQRSISPDRLTLHKQASEMPKYFGGH